MAAVLREWLAVADALPGRAALAVGVLAACAVLAGAPANRKGRTKIAPTAAAQPARGPSRRQVGNLMAAIRGRSGRQPRASSDAAALIAQLAAVLRSGMEVTTAWALVADNAGADDFGRRMRAAAAAVATGRSPAPAVVAARPGRRDRSRGRAVDPAAGLAAAWSLVAATGAAPAASLEALAEGIRAAQDAARGRAAALAAPQATARVLAVLPVLGLAMGQLMGADPVSALAGTAVGRMSALTGLLFAGAGLMWTRALLRAAGG